MDAASKILIVAGMLQLIYGWVTGIFFAAERQQKTHAHRYLVMTHTGSFLQAAILLGLVFAVRLSSLGETTEAIAVVLLAVFSFCIADKDTINWATGTEDEFQGGPLISKALGAVGVTLGTIGLAILVYGVLTAVCSRRFDREKKTEGARFELADPCGSPVFKTGAFSRTRPPLRDRDSES